MAGSPNTIISVHDDRIPPPPAPTQEVQRTIGFNDGRVVVVSYGPGGGGPPPQYGEDGSWMFQPGGLNGAQIVEQYRDDKVADNFRQQGVADSSAPHVVGDDKSGRWQWNPETNAYDIPVTQPGVGAAPPKNYTLHAGPQGSQIIFDASTGKSDYLRDANGNVVTDPMVAAQHVAALNASNASTASTYQGMTIAQNRDTRENAIYNRDTNRQQYLDDQALAKDQADQSRTAWNDQQTLRYTIPRQLVADQNQARQYQGQEAERAISGAVSRENVGRQAGQDAVSQQQWLLQHTVTPQQRNAMNGVAMGGVPNPAAYTTPMPDLGSLFEDARSKASARIPTPSPDLNGSKPYGYLHPDLQSMFDDYMNQIYASNAFLPAIRGQQ